jgi:pimeloyl-ACP methyl ester carboxylesterase
MMPLVENAGCPIYFEVEGYGPPLLLHHGFSQSLETWRLLGYAEALRRDRRLVLLDGRGHGRSAKPHDPAAYGLRARVDDVLAVLDALGIPRVDFLGYSMGGWIGFGLARHAPERLRSLIVGGAHPFADARWREQFQGVDGTDPAAFLSAFEATVRDRIPEPARPLVLGNDLRALAASATDRPSTEPDLGAARLPCLLYAGELDARHDLVRAAAQQIPGATFLSLRGLGHVDAILRSDLVLPHLRAFLARVPTQEQPPFST